MRKKPPNHPLPDNVRMGFPGNTPGRQMGRLGVVVPLACWMVVGLAGLGEVRGQEGGTGESRGTGESGGAQQAIQAPLVDISHARRAHRQVEDWLKEGQPVVQPATPIPVTGLFGVRITLRTRGFVIGHGQAYRADPASARDQAGPPVDLMRLLAQACGQAIRGVQESLADAQLKSMLQGRVTYGMEKPTVAKASGRILVDLELGYDLKTIHLPPDASKNRVYAQFAPGYHGLGFTGAQDGVLAWVWPGEAIARNINPTSQLTLGLKRAGYDRARLPDIAKPDGPGMLRFKTLHLVRPVLDLDPILLVRGKADQPRYTVSEKALEEMGDQLIEHLGHRFTLQDRILGTYLPTAGRYDPPFASDDLTALTCYAITHHCRYLAVARPDDGSATTFARRALKVATDLGVRLDEAGDRAQPQAVALVLLTLLETPVADADKALRDRLGLRLLALTEADPTTDREAADGQARITAVDALVLAALTTLYDQTRSPRVDLAVQTLMGRAWRGHTAPDPSALPWLILAHQRAGDFWVQAEDSGIRAAQRDRRREIIARLIDWWCEQQVIETPRLGPEDVLGAFVLTPPSPDLIDGPPNPDWHNAQALIFLAAALRDEAITRDNDKLGWLLSAGYSARFIKQLMMDETSSYYAKDPDAVLGGVRIAPWDNRLALAPSAMSLIAVTELQTTLASLRPGIESTVSENPDAP